MHLSAVWALNYCFWLYFAFYATTYECFEVLLVVQRVLRHAISISKVYFDISLVTLHRYTNLHTTYLYTYLPTYTFTNTTYSPPHTHTHLPIYRYEHTNIHPPTHIHVSTTHTHSFMYAHSSTYKDTTPNNSVASIYTTYYHPYALLPAPTTITYYHHHLRPPNTTAVIYHFD